MSRFDLAIIDYWAASGRSFLHRAGPAAKMVMAGGMVLAVVATRHLTLLAGLYLLLVGLLVAARVPPLKVMAIAGYPALFVLLFAISAWDGTWQTPARLFGRALTAALAVVTMLATTPYPRVFGVLSRLLPRLVSETLLLTYRAVFIVLDMAQQLVTAAWVRSGVRLRHPGANLRNLSAALGKLLIHALDRAEREYAIMMLRGYRGRVAAAQPSWNSLATDAVPVALGLAALAAAAALRWSR